MPTQALLTILYGALVLEAVNSGLWINRLLPTLAVRDWTTLVLIAARGLVSSIQLVGAVFLRTGRLSGAVMARLGIIASAVLMPLEIGLRLVPSNSDPTYRWWVVAGYWLYALLALFVLRRAASGDAVRS